LRCYILNKKLILESAKSEKFSININDKIQAYVDITKLFVFIENLTEELQEYKIQPTSNIHLNASHQIKDGHLVFPISFHFTADNSKDVLQDIRKFILSNNPYPGLTLFNSTTLPRNTLVLNLQIKSE